MYKDCPGTEEQVRHRLPATKQYFHKNHARPDKMQVYCRECMKYRRLQSKIRKEAYIERLERYVKRQSKQA